MWWMDGPSTFQSLWNLCHTPWTEVGEGQAFGRRVIWFVYFELEVIWSPDPPLHGLLPFGNWPHWWAGVFIPIILWSWLVHIAHIGCPHWWAVVSFSLLWSRWLVLQRYRKKHVSAVGHLTQIMCTAIWEKGWSEADFKWLLQRRLFECGLDLECPARGDAWVRWGGGVKEGGAASTSASSCIHLSAAVYKKTSDILKFHFVV